MSIRNKIIFSFFISAFIITILLVFEYVSFIQVRNEMRFLEMTDSVRTKSLQVRRHEKNFLLYPDKAQVEASAIRDYLDQLDILTGDIRDSDPSKAATLEKLVSQYRSKFEDIEGLLADISAEMEDMKSTLAMDENFYPLILADSRDKPDAVADFLSIAYSLPPENPVVADLRLLGTEIDSLRDTGEDVIDASREFDNEARASAEQGINRSKSAILVFFPLFLLVGISAMLYISTNVVKRLKTLTDSIGKIGERYAPEEPSFHYGRRRKDEVGTLIEEFNIMNEQLVSWEDELDQKNQELVQSKKLAAIGTMASGVAHEINNPLNNINISAQVLKRKLGGDAGESQLEIVDDIIGQAGRLKGIVGNLLEFAREREPQLQRVELGQLIEKSFRFIERNMDTERVRFTVDSDPGDIVIDLDPAQMEQVFINLFSNAMSAMGGEGDLGVRIKKRKDVIKISVSDTGKGISGEEKDKIFDPFFTSRDKGTGLGLAITMNIVQKHGGSISVISEEGWGTIFEIELPERV